MNTKQNYQIKNIIFLFIIFATLLSACEDKEVDLKFPEDPLTLTVFGFLSPEDTITTIFVNSTRPIFYRPTAFSTIENAMVKITHNGKEYILPFDNQKAVYSIHQNQLKIRAGESYHLSVSAPNYKTVTAKATVVGEMNKTLEFLGYEEAENKNNTSYINVNVKLKWKDNPNTKNYYTLAMKFDDIAGIGEPSENQFYDDKNWNGKEKYSKDLSFSYYNYRNKEQSVLEKKISLALLNVDEAYYLYHKTASGFLISDENPFSEPFLIYSNIENGVGVFCSYQKYVITKDWKSQSK